MSGYLTLTDGKHLAVRNGFTVGRVAGCDLVIDDGKASRRHARIVVEAGVVEVEDLGSSNGTRLNDKPVTRRMLRDGDRIQIGATVLLYREGEAPSAAPTAMPKKPAAARSDDDDDLLGGPPAAKSTPPAPSRAADDDDDLLGASQPAPAAKAPAADDGDDLLGAAPAAPAAKSRPADDGDELFGDRAAAPAAKPQPPVAPPRPTAPPPPPPAPRADVVEFADEVVEVRKPAPAAASKPSAPAAGPAPSTAGRVLQFQNKAGGQGGLLGDDLGQVGGGGKALLVLGALALGAGIVWLMIWLVR